MVQQQAQDIELLVSCGGVAQRLLRTTRLATAPPPAVEQSQQLPPSTAAREMHTCVVLGMLSGGQSTQLLLG